MSALPPNVQHSEYSIKSSIALQYLDTVFTSPAHQLAADEALLLQREREGGEPVLRFWEPAAPFVVLGNSDDPGRNVNIEECRKRRIPVFRRSSGGGTVVQGPGCLNISLILRTADDPVLATAGDSNTFIMNRHASALRPLVEGEIAVQGFSDLTLGQRKFSGNAQRRLQHYFLFHGCFLLAMQLSLIEELLLPPPKQPTYRQQRSHRDFLCNLPAPAATVRAALQSAWNAHHRTTVDPGDDIERLVREKYLNPAWTFK
jgi:lipoate-protein ligase A